MGEHYHDQRCDDTCEWIRHGRREWKTIYGVSDYLAPGTTTDLRITSTRRFPRVGTYLASGGRRIRTVIVSTTRHALATSVNSTTTFRYPDTADITLQQG